MSLPVSNCDRLSGMPDEILHHILSFLPTPESVRTSVLSRLWRDLWRCVPTLHFDVDDLPYPRNDYGTAAAGCEQAEKINQFIACRDPAAPLLRFHLRVRDAFLNLPFSISPWIRYARCHGVRDMTVHIDWMRNPPPFPIFFDLPLVEELDLSCLHFTVPWTLPPGIAVSKLKVLSLLVTRASISGQGLTSLLSSCPAVQDLTIRHGPYRQDLDITAPNLQRLTIIDSAYFLFYDFYHARITCPKLKYLHLTIRAHLKQFKAHLPSLREASIDFSYSEPKRLALFSINQPQSSKQFKQVLVSLVTVEKLTFRLKCYPWRFLGHMRRFPVFHRLKQLKFSAAMGEEHIKQVFLRFVGCSPYLSSLQVIDEQEDDSYNAVDSYDQSVKFPPQMKPLAHLETVCVKGICNTEIQNDVLKLLSVLVRDWERVVVIR